MKLLNNIVYYIYKVFQTAGNITLIGLVASITCGIVSRYVFRSPFIWTEEVSTMLMVYLCFISGSIVTMEKGNIVADFFVSRASNRFRKAVAVIGLIGAVVFLTIACISVAELIPNLIYKSVALQIPRKVFYSPVLIGCAVMDFSCVVEILNTLFPGYDRISDEKAERARRIKEEEMSESEYLNKSIDEFVSSGD